MKRGPRIGVIAWEYPPLYGGMATYARALTDYLVKRGCEVHVFANRQAACEPPGTVHPVLTTDLARDLPHLARYEMDLWHAVNFGYAPLAMLKRPFVLTVHGNDFLRPWVRCTMDRVPGLWRAAGWLNRRAVRRAWYSPALRCVDRVLTCSRYSAWRFRREHPSAVIPRVIPNGVDPFFLGHEGALPIPRHPRRVLTVCNLDTANRRKNVDGCLEAMARVGRSLDLEYQIIGDGPLRPVLEEQARRLGIADRVQFSGRVSPGQLRQAYAEASLFLLAPRPNGGDIEGFGIVYLEAAALGTPSLATRCGGVSEAVAEGVSGFFADDPSPEAIARGLERFFGGAVRFDAPTVRDHARRHAWPRVLGRVEAVYHELLPGRTRQPERKQPVRPGEEVLC